jgi:uncharacterized protein involved in exopolysaccharide biosynthesis
MPQPQPARYASGTHLIDVTDDQAVAEARQPAWTTYLWAVVRRWPVALLAFIAGTAVGYGSTFLMAPVYETSATLLVAQPKFSEQGAGSSAVNVTSFRALLSTNAVAVAVIRQLHLDEPPHSLSVRMFLSDTMSVQEVRGTNLIRVLIRMRDPKLAADVANLLGREAIELNRRINQEETVSIRDFLKVQVDEARTQLGQAEQRLLEMKRVAQLELRRTDTEARVEQRGELLRLLVDIEGERARLARAEKQLAEAQRTVTLQRSFDGNRALLEGARSADSGAPLVGLQLQDQVLNPVWDVVAAEVAESRTRLSAYEHQRDELLKNLKLGSDALPQLTALYQHEIAVGRLETEHELARKVYSDLSLRYEQTRVQVASNSAQLQLVDPALPPDLPVWPRRLRMAAIGGILFLLVALSVLIGREVARVYRQPRAA